MREIIEIPRIWGPGMVWIQIVGADLELVLLSCRSNDLIEHVLFTFR